MLLRIKYLIRTGECFNMDKFIFPLHSGCVSVNVWKWIAGTSWLCGISYILPRLKTYIILLSNSVNLEA